MPQTLRLATFNCENLFSRARVLNLVDRQRSAELLGQIDELQGLLAQASYSAPDKRRIAELANALSRYVDIAVDRGKLFVGTGSKRRVVANGAADWDGGLRFRRASFADLQRENTAQVLRAVDADVQCLVEVEDRNTLDAFNRELLRSRYGWNMLIDGFDPRGIDLGLLSKLPFTQLRTHIFDRDGRSRTFSRDCLEVEIPLADGRPLHLLLNHFKSQGYGDARANDHKRRRQAEAVARIIGERHDLSRDLVAVLGDFNDSPQRAPQCLAPLLQLPGLSDVLALQFAIPDDRWTYHYRRNEQIDYILVSDALKACFRQAGIERRGMHALADHTIAHEQPFPGVTSATNAASDHAAVWADFEF